MVLRVVLGSVEGNTRSAANTHFLRRAKCGPGAARAGVGPGLRQAHSGRLARRDDLTVAGAARAAAPLPPAAPHVHMTDRGAVEQSEERLAGMRRRDASLSSEQKEELNKFYSIPGSVTSIDKRWRIEHLRLNMSLKRFQLRIVASTTS